MVTRGGSYTHEAAGHAAIVSTEIKSKEEGIIFSVSSCPQNMMPLLCTKAPRFNHLVLIMWRYFYLEKYFCQFIEKFLTYMKNISVVWAPGRAARTRRAGARRSARVRRPPPRPLPRPRPRPRTGRATRWRGGAGRADTPPDTAPPPAPGTSNQRRTSTSRTAHQAQATVRYYTDITHAGVGIFLSSKMTQKMNHFCTFYIQQNL